MGEYVEPAIAIARMEQTLESHNDRITSLHKRLGETQMAQGDQHTELKVIATELEEARSDIEESKKELTSAIKSARDEQHAAVEKMQENFDHKFETLTTAVRWGTGSLITLIGILSAILFQV